MKKTLAIALVMAMTLALRAEDDRGSDIWTSQAIEKAASNKKTLKRNPLKARPKRRPYSSISMNIGWGYRLKGYTDPRYVDDDKSDYLQATNYTGNAELINAFNTNSAFWRDVAGRRSLLLVGLQLVGYTHRGDSEHIPEIAPYNSEAIDHKLDATSRGGLGFFFGTDSETFQLDIGTSLFFQFVDEKTRTRRVDDGVGGVKKDENGNEVVEEVPGRGIRPDHVNVFPNLRMRFGAKDKLHLVFDVFREQFNRFTDVVNYSINIPIVRSFSIAAGNGFVPAMTMFIKPSLHIGTFDLYAKAGTILNYRDREITFIALEDSAYYNVGAALRF